MGGLNRGERATCKQRVNGAACPGAEELLFGVGPNPQFRQARKNLPDQRQGKEILGSLHAKELQPCRPRPVEILVRVTVNTDTLATARLPFLSTNPDTRVPG